MSQPKHFTRRVEVTLGQALPVEFAPATGWEIALRRRPPRSDIEQPVRSGSPQSLTRASLSAPAPSALLCRGLTVEWQWPTAFLSLLLLLTGCESPGPRFNPYLPPTNRVAALETVALTNRLDPESLKPAAELFRLGPGDRLEIEVLGEPISRTQTTVGPDGKIYFHLLPGLDVWGMTLAEVKASIERELTNFIRDQPTVTITLRGVESRRVWLLGRFQSPGVYIMPSPMTLLEAISLAGGTMTMAGSRDFGGAATGEEVADLGRAFLVRKGRAVPVDFRRLVLEGDLSQNIHLQPDDFIFVPSATAREVYVLGAVNQPRSVPYTQGLTLAGVVAHAGGPAEYAYERHVAVVRGSLSEPRVAVIDYKAIAMGKLPDVVLEPQDIIYVPFSPYRTLTRYFDLILNTFVASVAVNEGTRAVVPDAVTTGVVIPLQPVTPVTPTTR